MKKALRLLSVGASVAALAFLSSCGGSKDDSTPAAGPTISVVSVNGNTNVNGKNVTLEFANGDTVRLAIRITGTNLRTSGSFLGTTFPESAARAQDTVITANLDNSVPNNSVWKLRVRSTGGGADSVQVTFQRTMSRYSAVLLVAPLADNSSATFINLVSGTTYNSVQATNAPSNVDLGFAVGNTVGGILMSPDNWFTGTTEPYASIVGGWGTRNATQIWLSSGARISDYLTRADLATAFNNGTAGSDLNTSYVLSGAANAGISSRANSRVGNLTRGSTLVFKTAGNKHGIMTIGDVSTGAGRTGEVRVTYKVEQ